MPYKIALTSSDGERVDLHLGHAGAFRIVEVDEETGVWAFVETRKIGSREWGVGSREDRGCQGCGHNHDWVLPVAELLRDCRFVLTARIGPKPQELLRRTGITALEAPLSVTDAIPKVHAYYRRHQP